MADKGTYYLTTAIAYTSRKPHIGNTYEIILSDAIARMRRAEGYDVRFMTGTDEHGQKVEQNAKEAGVEPKQYVDKIAGEIKSIWDLMNTSYDRFIRTTDEDHVAQVQKIFKKLYDQGDIYLSKYEGWYCTACESFFTETQVVDGKCPDCGRPVQRSSEEAYFFRMSKYSERLLQYIEDHPEFIQPEARKKEMVNNFLKPGLQDLCVSRTSFTWGIPVSFDPKHVVYVWIDALSNYITGLGYDVDHPSELYKKYWPADVHIIGKDILRFHTIYWPIMLMALGEPLPKQVFGHPWLLNGDSKMSKSTGNVIYADDLARHFSVDGVRYYCLREMPFASDGNITYESMIARYNGDLANTLGNLVNRTIAMNKKYFDGVIQPADTAEPLDEELRSLAVETVGRVVKDMDTLHVADSLEEIMTLARRSNKYIDETAPWVLAKDEAARPRLGTVLYNLLESIRIIGILIAPFLPETGEKILAQLNVREEAKSLDSAYTFGGLVAGDLTGEAAPLFARIDEKKKLAEIEAEAAAANKAAEKAASKAAPVKEEKAGSVQEITIDDFAKVQLKVGQVMACDRVEGAKKLLVSQIRIGEETRQIVSGIAQWYTPEEFVGKKVVVVTNLKPVKLRGVLSEGMILCAEDAAGNLAVVSPEKDIETGGEVR
ncbi:MAG: methionine--tRNA ligase [Firmicutes bacterium]|nr:methionine--tRNA ligase [Bacillota bacterium]